MAEYLTLCPAGPILHTFVQNFILQPTGNSKWRHIRQICGAIVPNMPLKFRDPRLNLSWEILSEAVGGGIFDGFQDNFRPEVTSDVVSSVVVDPTGMKVRVKFV